MSGDTAYALGYSEQELDRLSLQATILEPYTRRLFLDAGISPGMHVLDLGCGSGDVSMLAAEIVGPEGEVTGIDVAQPSIQRAQERAARRGFTNIHFARMDLDKISGSFDAIVGRLVLMYLSDPAESLRRLRYLVRPSGILAFQEFDIEAARTLPECPLVAQCARWICAAFKAAGADTRMGMKLHSAFVAAGLGAPKMRLEGVVGAGPNFVGYAMLAHVVRSLLPLIEKSGIATPREVAIDTLAGRLRDECVKNNAVVVIPELISAWTTTSENT
jgi:SAM-dependent methyltransferase